MTSQATFLFMAFPFYRNGYATKQKLLKINFEAERVTKSVSFLLQGSSKIDSLRASV